MLNKTIIAPIIAFLILGIKVIFKVDVPDDLGGTLSDYIVTGVSLVTTIWGIFKNHKVV